MFGLGNKDKKEKQEQERQEDRELERDVFKSAATASFQESPDNPVEFMTALIEPSALGLYGNQKVIDEETDVPVLDDKGNPVLKEDGTALTKSQFHQTIQDQIKILRDLPLGNFTPTDEQEILILIDIAEHCDDMALFSAADYYVKVAYQKINATRGRGGFLQKSIMTKGIELTTKKSEDKKKSGGVLSW